MNDRIHNALHGLSLGRSIVLSGLCVTRRSLFGFSIEGSDELFDLDEVAARIPFSSPPKAPIALRKGPAIVRAPAVRVQLCARCQGDGLGRRNRGACGLCHGPGIQVLLPHAPSEWDRVPRELVGEAVRQALAALAGCRYDRARSSLISLLHEMAPHAPDEARRDAEAAIGEAFAKGGGDAGEHVA